MEKASPSQLPLYTRLPSNELGVEYTAAQQSSEDRRRKSTFLRIVAFFIKAVFFFSAIFYLSLSLSVGLYARLHSHDGVPSSDFSTGLVPSAGMECVAASSNLVVPNWTHLSGASRWSYAGSFETSFPLSSDVLHLYSSGLAPGGTVRFHPATHCGHSVRVQVEMHTAQLQSLDNLKICHRRGSSGVQALGLFVDGSAAMPKDAMVHINVFLPAASLNSTSVSRIERLGSDLVGFAHSFDDLRGKVEFGSLSILTRNMPITAQSLKAEKLSLITDNAPIEGSFTTTKSLQLVTSNAYIDVEVEMESRSYGFTDVLLKTSNARVDAALTLSKGEQGRGQYIVNAETSNGEVDVGFPSAPADSVLQFHGKTSNKAASTSLHPTYEGTFDLRTSNAAPIVHYGGDVEDPAGKGRRRHLEKTHVSDGRTTGSVVWESDDFMRSNGWVVLETSNAPVSLSL